METIPAVKQYQQKTVFVVDDNPDILKYVSGILATSDYKVITAASGAEALQQSKNLRGDIHLLLTDFQMPGMSGIELATEMSTDRPDLPVLIMSGFTGGVFVLNERWRFVAKPFIPSQLRALIVGMISRGRTPKFLAVGLN